jgi:hypothetical protein
MNTNETKAKLWNMCVEKGMFNTIKGDNLKEVQGIFEKIIKNYESFSPSQNIFDKIIDSVSIEIQNKYTITFEDRKKEYEELLTIPVPKTIDFSDKKDEHLENIEELIQEKQKERQNIFDSIPKQIKLEDIIITQNKILMQILETQVKILDALKK